VKSNFLIPIALGALLFGSAIANAQTQSTSTAGQTATTPSTNQAEVTKGNDLVDSSQAVPPTRRDNARSDGEDKADGNDLVSPDKAGVKQAMATRPSFNSLDTQKKGSLTADDIKGNKWLSKNFSRCDTDHDGTLDRKEYAACK
jgi:hypothetical protein